MASKRVLIYGGQGALGQACIAHFKSNNFWVGSIDLSKNDKADASITVSREGSWIEQETEVLSKIEGVLNGDKLDAIICVAGGWAGGNCKKDLAKNAELMWKQSVWTSSISASVGSKHLKEGGLIALTGAKPALSGTPGMIGYGMAKAAVHQLTKSLSEKGSGLPDGSLAVCILPITLDTPMNRKWMPKADVTTWTPLTYVAEVLVDWTKGENRPSNGSLLQLVTKDSSTSLVPSSN